VLRVALVLRGGGEYLPHHAQVLAKQVERNLCTDVICLTDVAVPGVDTVPLTFGWPGWWAKMELFDPKLRGDLLYLDLDTVVLGDLSDIASVNRLTILRDFYRDGKRRPEGLGSGLMYLPEADRAEIWDQWIVKPERHISEFRLRGVGDQAFLERWSMDRWARWQDLVPGQIASWKANCLSRAKTNPQEVQIPPSARVLCFHGYPRPWQIQKFKDLYS
jgi:hypothetical protein